MQSATNSYAPIKTGEIVQRLWAGRWVLLIFCVIGMAAAIVYLHAATYSYTATLTLAPAQSQNQSTANSIGGSIAALTGLNLPVGTTASPFILFPEALKSRVVSDDLATNSPAILERLFEDQWDESTHQWHEPRGTVYALITFAKGLLGIPNRSWTPPDGSSLQELIVKRVRVERDTRNPVLRLSFDHPDPVFAQHVLDALHSATDRFMRQMTLDRSSKYIQHLQERLETAKISDVRLVLVNSLSEQITLVMMASSNIPFAANPIGGAERSLTPTSPNPLLVLFLSLFLGVVLGGAFVCRTLLYPGWASHSARAILRDDKRGGGIVV